MAIQPFGWPFVQLGRSRGASARGARRHRAAPGPAGVAARLDHLAEAVEAALAPPGRQAERAAELLGDALGLVLHLDRDLGGLRVDRGEGDPSGVVLAADRAPGDDAVG